MTDFYHDILTVFPDWQYGHPPILHGFIRSLKPKVCVEVGTYLGFGAAWMAQALKENGSGHLYCIDDFSLCDRAIQQGNARLHLEQNLAKLELTDWVTIIEGPSADVSWPANIDFAYIDGWHSYLAARNDFLNANYHGAECICLDDTVQSVGPRMLVQEIRQSGIWDVLEVLRDCGMAICMRRREKGPITFSQELPHLKGVDLQSLTHAEREAHFEEAEQANGLDYHSILNLIHPGRVA